MHLPYRTFLVVIFNSLHQRMAVMQFSFAKMHTMLSQLREKSCNSQDAHRQSIVEVRVNQWEVILFCDICAMVQNIMCNITQRWEY